MTKHILTTLASILIISQANAQINLDSLKTALEKTHIQVKGSNDWNAYTIQYLDQDSLLKHEIPYSREGKIQESIWGIALTSYSYDKQGREIERRYYDAKGNLHFSDWPPIIKRAYNKEGQLWRKTYYGEDEKILEGLARFEFRYDDDGDIIEEKTLNGKLETTRLTKFEFNEGKNVVVESNYNDNSEFISRQKLIYQTKERKKLLEMHHLDIDNNHIEIKHSSSKIDYSIMRINYNFEPNWVKIELLDKDSKKVHEYSQL